MSGQIAAEGGVTRTGCLHHRRRWRLSRTGSSQSRSGFRFLSPPEPLLLFPRAVPSLFAVEVMVGEMRALDVSGL